MCVSSVHKRLLFRFIDIFVRRGRQTLVVQVFVEYNTYLVVGGGVLLLLRKRALKKKRIDCGHYSRVKRPYLCVHDDDHDDDSDGDVILSRVQKVNIFKNQTSNRRSSLNYGHVMERAARDYQEEMMKKKKKRRERKTTVSVNVLDEGGDDDEEFVRRMQKKRLGS